MLNYLIKRVILPFLLSFLSKRFYGDRQKCYNKCKTSHKNLPKFLGEKISSQNGPVNLNLKFDLVIVAYKNN